MIKDSPTRFNVKMISHDHVGNKDEIEQSIPKNKQFYGHN
eukprot:CAMPEP_0116889066 /NCGR_PEP_ID=MMETSP0463-20121206/24424_1 /TAXON_ID=181622 /ORGANISM="Strombidinopsis sp, Strain SopsisLIS2011" /LENGTH=39 /DNA_ID= /DNA_START= /DNA_END= /DNA_ORIENTATION=